MSRYIRLFPAILLILCVFASAKDKFQKPAPIRLDHDGEKWAGKTLKKLSLEEKIGQLFMIWTRVRFSNLNDPEYIRLRDSITRYHVGSFGVTVPLDGPFLIRNQPYEAAFLLNQLQRDSKYPLIFAADLERGVSMRLYGTTVFPHAMAFGAARDLKFAEAMGRITAEESRALGIHWNFFPVADVNSNPVNPIINTRAFGEDPQQVGDLAVAYIRGSRQAGMLTTAKHFPGHGDTATDSHLGFANVTHDAQQMQQLDLPPFQKTIDAGVDSVMVTHVTAPALDPDPNLVGTVSRRIIVDLLKNKMGFKGLVVTDALDMNGLMRLYSTGGGNPSAKAAVAAFKAGNDMLLIPQDIDGAYNGMLQAVRSGEIPQADIDAAVLKVLQLKASVGLHKARLVDVNEVAKLVSRPENVAVGQQVADAAVTLVRDNGQTLPLKAGSHGTTPGQNAYTVVEETRSRVVAVIFSDDMRSESGRAFERNLRQRVPDAQIMFVDPRVAAAAAPDVLAAVEKAQVVVAPVYMIPTAGKRVRTPSGEVRNTVSLGEEPTGALLREILKRAAAKTVVVAMGNPYIASDFPEAQTYLCTFSNATVSELSAVKALFGEIAIGGRLPVTIPQIAERGAGIDRPQKVQGAVSANATNSSTVTR